MFIELNEKEVERALLKACAEKHPELASHILSEDFWVLPSFNPHYDYDEGIDSCKFSLFINEDEAKEKETRG